MLFPSGESVRRVMAVLAVAFDLAEQRLFVELSRPIRIAQTAQARDVRLLIDHHVETVEGVEQAVRAGNFRGSFSTFAVALLPMADGVRR